MSLPPAPHHEQAPIPPPTHSHSVLYSETQPPRSSFLFCCCYCFRPFSKEGGGGGGGGHTDPISFHNHHSHQQQHNHNNENDTISSNHIQKPPQQQLPPVSSSSSSFDAKPITSTAVSTVFDLPPGWKPVTSRSRPDRTAFLNEFTGERISWVPTEPASTVKGEIKKQKKRSGRVTERNSNYSSGSDGTVVKPPRNSYTTSVSM